MLSKIKNLLFVILFSLFIFLIINFYFSEKNIISTNKIRSHYLNNYNLDFTNLPLLKNDTENIIVYKDDLEDFNKKKKKDFLKNY